MPTNQRLVQQKPMQINELWSRHDLSLDVVMAQNLGTAAAATRSQDSTEYRNHDDPNGMREA
jgi:hypothetical protein